MPSVPQAKFQFVAEGGPEVQAQAQAINNKLIQMKAQAREASLATRDGMEKARISAHLLNEELGLGIPRSMQKVITMVPGLSKALSVAFSAVAVIGFVDIINSLIEKMPELTDAMMGFGAEAKKAFDELNKTNAELSKAIDERQKQAREDAAVAGKQGAARTAAILGLKQEDAGSLQNQKTLLAKEFGRLAPISRDTTMDTFTGEISATEEAQHATARMEVIKQRIAELDVELQKAGKDTDHLGAELTDQLGNEAKAAAEKARAELEKVRLAFIKLRDEMERSKQMAPEQAASDENKRLGDQLGTLRKALDNGLISQRDFQERQRTLLADHFERLRVIAREGWQKILTPDGFTTGGGIPDSLFVGITNPLDGLKDKFASLQKQITASLEAEAAAEQLVKDKAAASGEDQLSVEQKLLPLRTATAEQLQAIADKMLEIANRVKDPTMLEAAKKFEAKLQDLRVKTANWATDLKKTLQGDVENAFVGIVSGTETVSQAFQRMAQSILAELAKIIFQMYIVKLLQAALGSFGGSGGGGGAASAPQPGLNDAGFGGIIPHAAGGPVMSGMTYLIGERGPELLTVGASGYITPNNQIGGAMGKAPIVNIHNYGPPMDQQQTSHFDGEQFVIDVVVKNIDNNGAIRQKLR